MNHKPHDGSAEPILALLRRDQEWVTNKELADALGFVNARGSKSVVGHWPNLFDQLRPEDTILRPSGWPSASHTGGQERFFSKRAVVVIALRARTANARAFQDWLVDRAAEKEVWHG